MKRSLTGRLGWMLVYGLMTACAWAQGGPAEDKGREEPIQTYYLNTPNQGNDVIDIVNAVRNTVTPSAHVYLVPNQSAMVVRSSPADLVRVQKLLADLDRPKKQYRLIYTVTEVDGAKRVGVQHFSLVLVGGGKTTLKSGSKVPVVTGMYNAEKDSQNAQITYLDIGLNIDAAVDDLPNGTRLKTKVEQTSVAEEKSGAVANDPVVRQASLEGTSFLNVGKPVVLGSLDVPGSTRHLDLEVVMESVR